jgi:hypothetical protein
MAGLTSGDLSALDRAVKRESEIVEEQATLITEEQGADEAQDTTRPRERGPSERRRRAGAT